MVDKMLTSRTPKSVRIYEKFSMGNTYKSIYTRSWVIFLQPRKIKTSFEKKGQREGQKGFLYIRLELNIFLNCPGSHTTDTSVFDLSLEGST